METVIAWSVLTPPNAATKRAAMTSANELRKLPNAFEALSALASPS
jgi:hypothetical protein